MKVRLKFILYLSAFFMAYDALNMPNIPILDKKPMSLFLSIIFVLINLDKIFNIKYNKYEIVFICLTIISFALGIFKCNYIYRNDYIGIIKSLNSVLGFIFIYLSFRIYFNNCDKKQFDKMIKIIFYGYVILTISFGSLELFYANVSQTQQLKNLFETLLFNKLEYIQYGRIHFLLSEPSFVGGYFYLIFVPTIIYLYRNKAISKNRTVILSIILTVLNLLSFSNRFIIDTLVFIIIAALVRIKNKSIIYKYVTIIIFAFIIITFNVVFIRNVFNFRNSNLNRIQELFVDNQFSQDKSFTVRETLLSQGIHGFIQKPLTGWGNGAYKYVLINDFMGTGNTNADEELYSYINSGTGVVSYSFYVTTICENGVIGILIVLCVMNMCLGRKKHRNKIMQLAGLFILYIFIQNEFNSYLPIMVWMAIFNSKTNAKEMEIVK